MKKITSMMTLVFISLNLHAKSLCSKGEHTYFSCQIDIKEISFCGQPNKFLEYRYGTLKKIEMSYRADAQKNRKNKINHILMGNDIFFFKKNDYYYSLSIPMKGYPVLQIKKNQKITNALECKTADSWSGENKFLKFISDEEINDLDSIL